MADADATHEVGDQVTEPRESEDEAPQFSHPAEEEFARLLDFYGVEWQYEPRAFPLEWREGRVTRMFRPDFYLPEFDLYIEITLMKQALVRRKNRKLRLLRELYPEVNIKLLYRRDFRRLLSGFGLPAPDPVPGEAA